MLCWSVLTRRPKQAAYLLFHHLYDKTQSVPVSACEESSSGVKVSSGLMIAWVDDAELHRTSRPDADLL